jgi:beta-alanine--pyruvate transaminase
VCGIELEGIAGKPGARAYDLFTRAFWDKGLLIRTTADVIALSPPLIINKAQIDEMFGSIADLLKSIK